ncbi:MAG: vWA domain-containing protein [Acidobacteria bacterium]|nr:vWA domain-containing protein [Acidobacteriota bacterium]
MKFVFSRFFYLLLACGLVPLSLSWTHSWLRWVAVVYDMGLLVLALVDARISRLPPAVHIARVFDGRFAVGGETEVRIEIQNRTPRSLSLIAKDEYPPQMKLNGLREAQMVVEGQRSAALVYALTPPKRGRFEFGQIVVRFLSRLGLVWRETRIGEPQFVKVYPNMRRAREVELKALGARSLVASHRKSSWRGEGREFESLRDYVRGDEMRHISWSATARRGRITTRQYQIERDQNILIAIDAGRLMTARIETETKLDSAVHAALALMSAAARAGDNAGLVVFGRRIRAYLPPNRGREQMDAVLEALYPIEPEMIEPSYARAFAFIAANTKRRSLVVVLTDLVDEEGSRELLTSLRLLRPRHLPLVVTIADRDLKAVVRDAPATVGDLFTQSVAEEIIHQREAALRLVESQGGLALDVTAAALAPALLEKYLQVKDRGLL